MTENGGCVVKIEWDIADPALRKTAEGLLLLCGIRDSGGGEDGVLRVTDGPAGPAAEVEADLFVSRVTVVLVPRGENAPASAPAQDRPVCAIPVPVLLPEAAAVLTEAVRMLGEGGRSDQNDWPDGHSDGLTDSQPDSRFDSLSDGLPAGPGEPDSVPRRTGGNANVPEPAAADLTKPPERDGGITVSPDYRTVERGGVRVRLTEREAGYFRILYERRGETVTREELLSACGLPEPKGRGEKQSNVTDVYIGYLRKKLRPLTGDGTILSVRGRGYTLRLP